MKENAITKNTTALILAGGEGKRLENLTKMQAKPAIPFGGKYRIVDFVLTNLYKSGFDNAGIITQYRPLELCAYIGSGSKWKLRATFLPPHSTREGKEWYSRTADSVRQNLDYTDRREPDDVLILSADHVYSFDYSSLISFHKENDADITVCSVRVGKKDARRFGIIRSAANGRITGFEEKPEFPKSDLASMGIYVFKYPVLKKTLINDRCDKKSSHDFGKDIIPNAIKNGLNVYAYEFSGYWRDVGTVESYMDASFDLLKKKFDPAGTLTNVRSFPSLYTGKSAYVKNSIIGSGCFIKGRVENSVLFRGAAVEEGAYVKDCVIFGNVLIEKDSELKYCLVDEGSVICKGSRLAGSKRDGVPFTVESGVYIRNGGY